MRKYPPYRVIDLTAWANTTVPLTNVHPPDTVGTYVQAADNGLTVTEPGLYLAECVVRVSGTTAGKRDLAFRVNNTRVTTVQGTTLTGDIRFGGSMVMVLNANDIVTLGVYVEGASTTIPESAHQDTWLKLTYLGAR